MKEIRDFFDIKIVIIILIVFFLLISPFNIIIPNYFDISGTQSSNILNIVIGALASILGIVIAVIVVAFNIFREYYNFYAFRTFFKNKKLNEFTTFYLLTITIAFLTSTGISNPLKPQIVNLIYLTMFLFIIALWIIFPYSYAIIFSTQPQEKIKKIVNQIDKNTITIYQSGSDIMPSFSIVRIEENPVFVLNELGNRSLNGNDWLTSIYILDASEKKLFNLLVDHLSEHGNDEDAVYERDNIIRIFLLIVKPIAYQSIKSEHEIILRNVWSFIEHLHYFFAQNRMPWYEFTDVDDFIKNLLKEISHSKLDTITDMGFMTVNRILNEHLKVNVPLEDEVFKLQFWMDSDANIWENSTKKEWDPNKGIQWDEISRNYIGIITETAENNAKMNNEEILHKGIIRLLEIIKNVTILSLGNYQKFDLVQNCCWGINDLIKIKTDHNLSGDSFSLTYYFQNTIEDIFENSTEKIIERVFYSYVYTFKILALNHALDVFELGRLGVFASVVAKKIDENILYRKYLILLITLFDKLRETIEEQSDNNFSGYAKLCENLIFLNNFMKEENIEDEEIKAQIKKVLSNFKEYEKIKEEIKINEIKEKWPYSE